MTEVTPAKLSWIRQDIEQRIGLRGGRFTRTNTLFTFSVALLATAAFYASLVPFQGRYFVRMFTERGVVQYVTIFFSAWALAILAVKMHKVRLQRRALDVRVVPELADFVLSSATAADVLGKLRMDPSENLPATKRHKNATNGDSRGMLRFVIAGGSYLYEPPAGWSAERAGFEPALQV